MNKSLLKFLFLLTFIGCQQYLFSQNYTTKKTAAGKALKEYNEGVKYNIANKFEAALESFTKALKADPNFIDAQIQQAASYYRLGKLPEAEKSFEKVESIDLNYEPEILYSLGNIELKQGKNAEAIAHYELYGKSNKVSAEKKKKLEKVIKDAKFAENAMKNPVPFNPKSLGDKINTPQYSEYLPTLTADGEMLIYTARVNKQEDFYMSKKVNDEWQKGEPMTELNTDENEGAECISADGNLMLYTVCNRVGLLGGCDIFFSQKKEGKWSTPRGFTPISSTSWDSQPTISADSKTIYFASDRPGGLGGKDIWYVVFENGKWSEARNMGSPINTPEDDQTPFIHQDGITLYFTSEGLPGMGGKDIYVSRRQADSTWSEPQNLGYPINTKEDEGTISVAIDGKTAFYARNVNQTGVGTANYDLFYFELPEADRAQAVTYVKTTVRDGETNEPLSKSRLEIIDLASQKNIFTASTDEQGASLIVLPYGKNYALNISKDKYVFQSENFNLTEKATFDKPFLLNINLQPLKSSDNTNNTEGNKVVEKPKVDKAVVLKNVFFDTDKAVLKPESFAELNKLKLFLNENPTVRIEIRGHTDNEGSDTHNLDLSERRANAVKDFLIQKGIKAERLQSKGFGESMPVDNNDTPQARANNRRTEFVILK